MQRETTTITTPLGNVEVVLKSYLTGREKREITNAALPKSVDYNGTTEGISDIDIAEITNRGEDAVIKNVILSIGGNTDANTFVDTILDMRCEDSDFVLSKVKEIADALTTEKKTK